jgi:hypothetical protein
MLEIFLSCVMSGLFGVSLGARLQARKPRRRTKRLDRPINSIVVRRAVFKDPNCMAWSKEANYMARCRGIK